MVNKNAFVTGVGLAADGSDALTMNSKVGKPAFYEKGGIVKVNTSHSDYKRFRNVLTRHPSEIRAAIAVDPHNKKQAIIREPKKGSKTKPPRRHDGKKDAQVSTSATKTPVQQVVVNVAKGSDLSSIRVLKHKQGASVKTSPAPEKHARTGKKPKSPLSNSDNLPSSSSGAAMVGSAVSSKPSAKSRAQKETLSCKSMREGYCGSTNVILDSCLQHGDRSARTAADGTTFCLSTSQSAISSDTKSSVTNGSANFSNLNQGGSPAESLAPSSPSGKSNMQALGNMSRSRSSGGLTPGDDYEYLATISEETSD